MLCGGLSRPLSTRGSKLMFRSSRWRPSRLVRASIALGFAIMGTVLVWVAVARPSTPDTAFDSAPNGHSTPSTSPSAPKPTPERSAARADQTDHRDQITGLVLPESDPVAVSIPRIDVQSTLVPLGLKSKGEMELPDPAVAGWFTGGATPGALGPAVITGHVTWNRAPAVFHRLGTLRRGDQVIVTRKDGKTAVFTVSRVDRFSKSRFPSQAVYGTIDHAGLRLITCGGTYDAARHKYLDNVVVFARLEAVRGPGG
jgi:sortase (surface protein transpeptidase)